MKVHSTVLFFNGLGDGVTTTKQEKAFAVLRSAGIDVYHASTNWRSADTLDIHLSRSLEKVQSLCKKVGSVTILAHSAAGSLGLNLLPALASEDITLASVAARLKQGPRSRLYPWHLDRSAHMGTDHESPAFRDSVIRCENETMSSLSDEGRAKGLIIKPRLDLIVPLPLMDADGIETITVNAFGHDAALLSAARLLATNYEAAY